MSGDTPRTDERWETVERFMIAAFPTTLPGWQDTDAALKALRRQLEQTERDYAAFRQAVDGKTADWPEKLDRIAARLEQTKKERDAALKAWPLSAVERVAELAAALRDHHADLAEWRKANDKALDLPCGICGRALTTQEEVT